MPENKHKRQVPKEVLEQVQAKIDEAVKMLEPYMLALTPTERRRILKMGEKTLNFVEKSHKYANENKSLVPQYINMEDFDIDFADAHGLWLLYNRISQLKDGVADIQMTAGSEAFRTALIFYNSVKVAASQGIHGASALHEELKKRFPRTKRRKSED